MATRACSGRLYNTLVKFSVIIWTCVYVIRGELPINYGSLVIACVLFSVPGIRSNCEEPPPVPNAIRQGQWQGGDVSYSCYPHHVLVSGDLYRCCEEDIYDGDEPKCVYDCGAPRTIPGTLYSLGSTLQGSTISYDCDFPHEEFGSNSPDVQCDEETKQWTHTQFMCYDTSSANLALNKPALHNGNSASYLVDGSDSTCNTVISDHHLIEIDLGQVVNVIKLEIIIGNELPLVNVSVLNSNNNILSTCKISLTSIPPWTPTTLHCNPTYSTRAPGDILYVAAKLLSPMQMSFCEMKVTATNYYGDCGKPPTQPGQEASYTTTGENSIATISCVSPWHAKSGSNSIVCHLTQWSQSSLECTLESNIAENAVAMNVDGEAALDNDISTCYTGLNNGINNPNWQIDLLALYSISSISVTFGVNGMNIAHYIKISDDNGGTRYCQPEYPRDGVTLFDCPQGPVGKYINMTAAWPIHICDVKVHGMLHQGVLDCSMDSQGRDYKGYQTVTVFGKTCLPWLINSSFTAWLFPDVVASNVANHCRNPQTFEKERPWCLVSQTEWELCPVFECSSFCKTTTDGFQYDGEVSFAVSNKTCEMWRKSRFRHDFSGNVQHCQNTYKDQTQPWCITDLATNTYEFCLIPDCPKTVPPTITVSENSTGFDYENELQTCMHWSPFPFMAPWNPLHIHLDYRGTILNSFCPWSGMPIIRLFCIRHNLQLTFLDFICDPGALAVENTESSISSFFETTVALSSASPSVLTIDSSDMTSFTFTDQTLLSEAISMFETSSDNLQESTDVSLSDSLSEIQSSTLIDIQPSTTIELLSITDALSYYITTSSVASTHQLNTDTILEPSSQDSTTLQPSAFPLTDSVSESSPLVTSASSFLTNVTISRCPCLCNNNPFWDEAKIKVYKLRLFELLHLDKRNLSSTYRKKNCIRDNRPLAIATGGVGVTVIICVFLYLASSDVYLVYNQVIRILKT
ncbi:hypothetical protein LOTGIDRAFT_166152 [Lottia gigantea]|uniref:Kringle domain-containing protein n=1 Tax=Lottia gigantea TaxID=225164 RepID=V4A3R4_LOTGI|nr:hypothetical protein LOTGIDRAFT_166152 [Lottia gigantea]ESO87851.1 hypothetical protein LOTGIDRAFT_166152 [Lottia gigantea]